MSNKIDVAAGVKQVWQFFRERDFRPRDADGTDYVVYHAYDRENKGAPTLRIAPLRWGADGWPVAEGQ